MNRSNNSREARERACHILGIDLPTALMMGWHAVFNQALVKKYNIEAAINCEDSRQGSWTRDAEIDLLLLEGVEVDLSN